MTDTASAHKANSGASTEEIPDRVLPLKWASVVRDGAVHGEALVETNREGYGGLAGRRIAGGWQRKVQGPVEAGG